MAPEHGPDVRTPDTSEARLRAIVEASLDAVVVMDERGNVIEWSRQAEAMFGWPAAEAVGRPVAELMIPERLRAAHDAGLARYRATGDGPVLGRRIELSAVDRSGREFPVEISITALGSGERTIFSAFVRDLSREKEAAGAVDALAAARRDLDSLHAVALEAGRQLDGERLADFAVTRARALLGVDTASLMWWEPERGVLRQMARSKLAGAAPGPEIVRPGEAISGRCFERRETMVVDDAATVVGRPGGTGHRSAMAVPLMIGQRIVGTLFVGSLAARRFTPEEARVLELFAAAVAPAIEAGQLFAAAQRAARVDALTGLPNRAALTEGVGAEIGEARATGRSVALMYVGLDDIRSVADAFGTALANEILREVPRRIGRLGDLAKAIGRFRDDEFAVCMPLGTPLSEARRAATLALDALAEPFEAGGHSVHVAANVGIVVSDGEGASAEELFREAERAMLAAKGSGSRYAVYGPDLDPRSQEKIALLADLRVAIASGQLFLRYEPQVCLQTGGLVGVEALARWHHPTLGEVPPARFIPVAEESGLIVELTSWVIDRALAELPLWRPPGSSARLSVNVGMRNLRDPAFVEIVEAALRRHAVAAGTLTLEITEGAVMLEPERTMATLRGLRKLGVGVAIDDFGTGYSSLGLLGQLPVDELKVDRAFVAAVAEERGGAIVRTVVELGRAFGLRVVAEGVEDVRTLPILRALGCAVAQGYALSRPVAARDLAAWVGRGLNVVA